MRKRKKSPSSIADKIEPVGQADKTITAMFYGRSGTGKTTLAASFPKPVLFLDIRERGSDSIADVEDAHVVKIETWEDFEELHGYLQDNEEEYKTVVIDALHTLQDICMVQVLEEAGKTWGSQVSQKDYGQISNKMKKWLLSYRDLRDLGINVVCLAHDRVTETDDEEDNQITPEVGPRVSPAISSFVLGGFNLVGNTFIREETVGKGKDTTSKIEYCLRLGPNKFYATKIRSPKSIPVPSYIVDPDYAKLNGIIKGESSKKTLRRRK